MEYVTVALPKALANWFEKIRIVYGYRTFSEFVIQAAREKLRELEIEKETGGDQFDDPKPY